MATIFTRIASGEIPSYKVAEDENYYAAFNSPAFGKCLLIFTPNENILEGMKSHLDKKLVIKLFYRKNNY